MDTTRRQTPARITLTVIGLVLITALMLLLVYVTHRVLVWIAIAAFFAVALHPTVNWVQRHLPWGKRWLATLVVFLAVAGLIAGLVAVFVVPLAREGSQFADDLPRLLRDAREGRGPVGDLMERFRLRQYAEEHSAEIQGYLSSLSAPTLAFLRGAATTVAGIATIFVLAYLMVLEAPKIIKASLALFSERRAGQIRAVGADCARTITGYLTGNLLISAICGTLTYVVLLIMDVPFAGLIALFVAIADLIPLIGATLGAIVAVGASFLHSTTAGIVVLVFFVTYQQLENHLLQPVIFARTVQLNPLTVLIAILVAVEVAGILGALLAIPIAGMIQVIVRNVWDVRRGRPKDEPTVGEDRTPVSQTDEGAGTPPALVGAPAPTGAPAGAATAPTGGAPLPVQ
ncbi:MAG TPA: AI-2E family transporter [Pilimelia sp.]|nr:AI-2E family transporter [Pilimelia sp.]